MNNNDIPNVPENYQNWIEIIVKAILFTYLYILVNMTVAVHHIVYIVIFVNSICSVSSCCTCTQSYLPLGKLELILPLSRAT